MDLSKASWVEHPENPILSPEGRARFIADPTVLLPEETPDGRWHLFANTIPPSLHHFVSDDGLAWNRLGTFCKGGMRAFVRRFADGLFHLFYEKITWPLPLRSRIEVITSKNLEAWSEPRVVLPPSLPWHGRLARTCSNPCVIPWRGGYRLYYSAATVWLPDCGFVEPRHIGFADAPSLDGPWTPHPEPLLSPSTDDPWRNMGAGAITVVPDPDGDGLWGFNNGIYRDGGGRSRSAVLLLRSDDGLAWQAVHPDPILAPDEGWKRGMIYALDVRLRGDGAWLYFNARDGWFIGRERIGLATTSSPYLLSEG